MTQHKTDRPEEYAIQQLLDEIEALDGERVGGESKDLLGKLAKTVVSEHDHWLHLACRRTRELTKVRECLRRHGHAMWCHVYLSPAGDCNCKLHESLTDEPEKTAKEKEIEWLRAAADIEDEVGFPTETGVVILHLRGDRQG